MPLSPLECELSALRARACATLARSAQLQAQMREQLQVHAVLRLPTLAPHRIAPRRRPPVMA